MAQRIGIVAVAQTKYERKKGNQSAREMILEVVNEVIQETGLHFRDDGTGIDIRLTATEDHLAGMLGSHQLPSYVMRTYGKPTEKVTGDGALEVYEAVMTILSGHYNVAMVSAHCLEAQVPCKKCIENWGFEQVYQQTIGLDYLSAAALQAKRYMHQWGVAPEEYAQVVIRDYHNARNNPYAQSSGDLTVEDVLGSKMLAYPVRELEAKPQSDGACVLIMANEDRAKQLTDKPVWIKGIGCSFDHHYLGDRELARCNALTEAAQRAYKMAGISNPWAEIDVAEISDHYSYQGLLWLEGLGLCPPGEGKRLIMNHKIAMGGELPVNPSGGLLPGIPETVAGQSRVVEAVLQLRGEAGARQVDGAKVALAHGTGGSAGQQHTVIILEK